MKNLKEFNKFKEKLKQLNISILLDNELRSDGKRLENYVFTKNGKSIKILESLINKDFGAAYYFTQVKKEFTYVPLSDEKFYDGWIVFITENLK
jgi:hypothetical protein